MKILYVGNFSQSHCTEVHIAATLEDLGHEVVRKQESELDRDWVGDRPDGIDLFLYTRTWGEYVTLEDLAEFKRLHIPTVSYHLDLYVGLKRENGLDEDPFWKTDFVFTPDGSSEAAQVFAARGINHHYIKPGVFKGECIDGNRRAELAHDVVFVGGGLEYMHPEWPYRHQLVRWLTDNYRGRFGKYGHPQPTMRNKDLNDLFASSKIAVGDSVCIGFTKDHYWSDRVYETLGRGGFIIHPYIKGMEEEFTDGENIVFYKFGDFAELKEKIDYYLDPTHAEERERIRRAGQAFVREHATYHNRLQQMLDVVFPPAAPSPDDNADTKTDEPASMTPLHDKLLRLNLGAGREPMEGWTNTDWYDLPGIDLVFNLLHLPYPFADASAQTVRAWDVLEHMPSHLPDGRSFPIELLNEIWRILQPGGEFLIHVPDARYPEWATDLTHVRPYMPSSFDHLDPDTELGQMFPFYSERKWQITERSESNKNLMFRLVKRA